MQIRPYQPGDWPEIQRIWNACVAAEEVLYYPLTAAYFERKFIRGEGCEPENLLVARWEDRPAGLIHGVAPETFRGGKPGNAYLTTLLVDPALRGRGIGQALLEALKARMKRCGAATLFLSSVNPVSLDWRIPGTPGHDHNNMPGADAACPGYGFLEHMGFTVRYREIAMYLDLSTYRTPPELPALRERLAAQGIYTGPYDAAWDCGYDAMCDAVGSDYWRDVLRTEIAAWKSGRPNADARFWADGVAPRGPRTLLTAVCNGQIVGFTGPVDRQRSGRGWFTGICTDPAYGRRGIATVLFNLLMEAFIREGAQFSTLFTGQDNPAQKVYLNAGMRPARPFHLMSIAL